MKEEKKLSVLRNALETILLEAKEPIIKVYAQSALDETKGESSSSYISKDKVMEIIEGIKKRKDAVYKSPNFNDDEKSMINLGLGIGIDVLEQFIEDHKS